jgi:branched-chain amino acid transport system ATP-binding protein
VPLLEISQLTKHFGGLAAVSEFDLTVEAGEICGLIGPNGAGKSTALNMIGGTSLPTKGSVVLDGTDITRLPAYRRARRGVARVFQRNALFSSMTALENVVTASHLVDKHGFWELFYKGHSARTMESNLATRAMGILDSVGLAHVAGELAFSLPHGDQRALCVAVALASEPRLLLLDEPLTGMNAEETTAMVDLVRRLRDTKGITVIVVEHNVKAVLGLCEHAVVLNYGKKMMEGTPRACVEDPRVIEAYLGTGHHVL